MQDLIEEYIALSRLSSDDSTRINRMDEIWYQLDTDTKMWVLKRIYERSQTEYYSSQRPQYA